MQILMEMTPEQAGKQAALVVVFVLFALMIGVVIFFIVSLVKAMTKKTTGWQICTLVFGLLSVLIAGGTIQLYSRTKAKMKTLEDRAAGIESGETKQYMSPDGTFSVQAPDDWTFSKEYNKGEVLFLKSGLKDRFFMVRPMFKMDFKGDLRQFDEFSMKTLSKAEGEFTYSPATPDTLGKYPALRHTAEMTNKNGSVEAQRIVCFETRDFYYLMVGGSAKSKAEASIPVLEQIMTSFHTPQEAP